MKELMTKGTSGKPIRVLFLCMGNICRSPTAEGAFRQAVTEAKLEDHFYIDSAGTHAYHVGEPPDPRSVDAALKAGIDIRNLRARQLTTSDFVEFDYILAMDSDNLELAQQVAGKAQDNANQKLAQLSLFLSFAPDLGQHVPDPYYGGSQGFQKVIELVAEASQNFLKHCRQQHF